MGLGVLVYSNSLPVGKVVAKSKAAAGQPHRASSSAKAGGQQLPGERGGGGRFQFRRKTRVDAGQNRGGREDAAPDGRAVFPLGAGSSRKRARRLQPAASRSARPHRRALGQIPGPPLLRHRGGVQGDRSDCATEEHQRSQRSRRKAAGLRESGAAETAAGNWRGRQGADNTPVNRKAPFHP